MATDVRPVVLIVEPRDDSRDMYVEFFRHHGFAPAAVSKPATALVLAPNADVIITGILLPGRINGIEFIERLKRDDCTRHIPIVVLTACVWTSQRERAVDAGCDVFLPKPCLPGELLREVHRLLASSQLENMHGKSVKIAPPNNESAHHSRLKAKRTA